MKFRRAWAMPNSDTFEIEPIREWVMAYLEKSRHSVDMFARNNRFCTATNDLNPDTKAEYHLDAEQFLKEHGERLTIKGKFDLALFDPPYSPRQISECYQSIGLPVGMKETQSALLYSRVRSALDPLMAPNSVVLSFGWNSVGMGSIRGYEIEDVLLVCHGGAHNDTICIAERRLPQLFD